MNVQLTIGNETPAGFILWIEQIGAAEETGFTIVKGFGRYKGTVEDCVVVTLWDVNKGIRDAIIREYLADHPEEESIGVLHLPDSKLVDASVLDREDRAHRARLKR